MRDVIHFTPVTAQDSYGACGSYAPFFSAEWKRVTCPECLKLQPAATYFDAKINTAISENYPMFFMRHGLWTVELRAVSYTFENGNSRTRLLRTFDIRTDLENIVKLYIELKKRLPAVVAPDIDVLNSFYWSGDLEYPIDIYVDKLRMEITS